MRIRVLDLEPSHVGFACSVGEGCGVWRSASIQPLAGREYDVEFDILEPLRRGENANLSAVPTCAIARQGDRLRITGLIECIDEDGMVLLRLAPDAITTVESNGSDFSVGEMVVMDIAREALGLWPFSS